MEPGLERFATHVSRLASYYQANETDQFVAAFSFIFGSVPLGNPVLASADMIQPSDNFGLYPALYEGDSGWLKTLDDNDGNPSHHYAGLFHTGYWYGSWSGISVNWLRDGPISDNNPPDIALGNGAARQGWDLRLRLYTIHQLADTLSVSLGEQPYLIPPGYPR